MAYPPSFPGGQCVNLSIPKVINFTSSWQKRKISGVYQTEFVLYGSIISWEKYCSGGSLPFESKTHDVLGDKG